MADIQSGKVKKTSPSAVPADRYDFIGLSDTEPDLGVPAVSGYVLASTNVGVRSWVTPQSGPTGPTGPTGAAGTNGTNGTNGATGPTGPTGPTGAAGPTGPTGAAGTNGTNGTNGVTGPTGPTGPINLAVQTGTPTDTNVLWLDTDEPGTAGPTGPTGASGATGPTGATGATGASGGIPPVLPRRSGAYYQSPSQTTIPNGTAVVNQTRYTPFYVPETATYDRIAIRTASTFSGTAVARLGIYNDSAGKPTTVVLDAGTVSCTAASTSYIITIAQSLTQGWYWIAANTQTAATTNVFLFNSQTNADAVLYGNPTQFGSNYDPSWIETATISGAFTTATAVTSGTGFAVMLRVQ